ncbi:MAG: diaminopimelate decarboxylase [Alphaproteobacteria bacterium]
MSDFAYRAGVLHAEDVPIPRIAEGIGTPFYCYASAGLGRRYRAFADAFAGLPATICYALKANSNLAVVRTLARLGAGADVVSEGELRRALAAGVPAAKIVFSGVGKTEGELALALETGILQINVESESELEALDNLARARGVKARVALRVNPDVEAGTHEKITTGRKGNKFGIEVERVPGLYARAATLSGIEPVGLAVHIGSQVTDLAPFAAAFARIAGLVAELRAAGHAVRRLDLGGGLGIAYGRETPPSPAEYASLVEAVIGPLEAELVLEPGRALVADAGVLVTRVLYVKDGSTRRYVIVDAAMNDLLRPALYDAYHAIRPVQEAAAEAATAPVDVVGPVCESGDTFAVGRRLPPVRSNDLLVIDSAGAYGAVMTSSYNTRPPAPEALVKGSEYAVVRPRPDIDDLLGQDLMPDWLAAPGETRSRGAA